MFMSNAYNVPPIFVISLKNSSRREFIAKRLRGLGLQFEFFDAFYGKELSEEELAQVDYHFYKAYNPLPLTLGEIGCATSHIKIYEHMVENNIPSAIILEDDAIVSQFFKEIIEDILSKIHHSYELVFLDHGKVKSYPFKKKLIEGYRLAHYRSPSKNSKRCIICAAAYLITLSGAQKLLNYAYPIRMPADYLTGLIQKTKVNAYGVEPPCVFRGLDTDSEIDQIADRHNK
jgi:lipooligosaccharide galactosyltransferase I